MFPTSKRWNKNKEVVPGVGDYTLQGGNGTLRNPGTAPPFGGASSTRSDPHPLNYIDKLAQTQAALSSFAALTLQREPPSIPSKSDAGYVPAGGSTTGAANDILLPIRVPYPPPGAHALLNLRSELVSTTGVGVTPFSAAKRWDTKDPSMNNPGVGDYNLDTRPVTSKKGVSFAAGKPPMGAMGNPTTLPHVGPGSYYNPQATSQMGLQIRTTPVAVEFQNFGSGGARDPLDMDRLAAEKKPGPGQYNLAGHDMTYRAKQAKIVDQRYKQLGEERAFMASEWASRLGSSKMFGGTRSNAFLAVNGPSPRPATASATMMMMTMTSSSGTGTGAAAAFHNNETTSSSRHRNNQPTEATTTVITEIPPPLPEVKFGIPVPGFGVSALRPGLELGTKGPSCCDYTIYPPPTHRQRLVQSAGYNKGFSTSKRFVPSGRDLQLLENPAAADYSPFYASQSLPQGGGAPWTASIERAKVSRSGSPRNRSHSPMNKNGGGNSSSRQSGSGSDPEVEDEIGGMRNTSRQSRRSTGGGGGGGSSSRREKPEDPLGEWNFTADLRKPLTNTTFNVEAQRGMLPMPIRPPGGMVTKDQAANPGPQDYSPRKP